MKNRIPFCSAVRLLRFVGFVFFIPTWTRRRRNAQSSPLSTLSVVDSVHSDILTRLISIAKVRLRERTTRSLGNFSTLSVLLIGPAGNGKTILARRLAHCLGVNYTEVDCFSLWSEVPGTGEAKLRNAFSQASHCAPCVFMLKRVDIIGKDSSVGEHDFRVTACLKSLLTSQPSVADQPMIVIGTALQSDQIPGNLSSSFLYRFSVEPLSDKERMRLIEDLCGRHSATATVAKSSEYLRIAAQRTAGFAIADMERVTETTRYIAKERALDNNRQKRDDSADTSDYLVDWADFEAALSREQSKLSDSIGAPKIPDVRWEDVGGLTDVKDTILESIRMYLDYPDLSRIGFRRSGILLYGPPGCGKTLIAKAVATECGLNFISREGKRISFWEDLVKGPELLNMYVGQSEQNIREVFERARFASPCVIFFDELDALAPNRGRSGDSGGVMDRVVSQLLAEMDGLEQRGDVFIIGATNRVDLIDPSLLRPGRFDKMIYVGIGNDANSRLSVFNAVVRKLPLDDDVDREEIVRLCPRGMSGADFYALAAEAAMLAARRKVDEIAEKRGGGKPGAIDDDDMSDADETSAIDCRVTVTRQDFVSALSQLKPSINAQMTSSSLRRGSRH